MNDPVELAINVDKVFAPLGSKNSLFNPNREIFFHDLRKQLYNSRVL